VANVFLRSRNELVACAPLVHSEHEIRLWVRNTLIPSGGVSVAVADDHVAAFLSVSRDAEAGWIDQLYVLPESIGQGIGSRLLQIACEELSPPIRLYTFQANQRARRFYEHHKFRIVAFGDGSANEEGRPDILLEWWPE